MICRICSEKAHFPVFQAREMMFGLRHAFQYYKCEACGCLQIQDPISDISKYYPENYYSFAKPSKIGIFLKQKRSNYLMGQKTFIGFLLSQVLGEPEYVSWLKNANVDSN